MQEIFKTPAELQNAIVLGRQGIPATQIRIDITTKGEDATTANPKVEVSVGRTSVTTDTPQEVATAGPNKETTDNSRKSVTAGPKQATTDDSQKIVTAGPKQAPALDVKNATAVDPKKTTSVVSKNDFDDSISRIDQARRRFDEQIEKLRTCMKVTKADHMSNKRHDVEILLIGRRLPKKIPDPIRESFLFVIWARGDLANYGNNLDTQRNALWGSLNVARVYDDEGWEAALKDIKRSFLWRNIQKLDDGARAYDIHIKRAECKIAAYLSRTPGVNRDQICRLFDKEANLPAGELADCFGKEPGDPASYLRVFEAHEMRFPPVKFMIEDLESWRAAVGIAEPGAGIDLSKKGQAALSPRLVSYSEHDIKPASKAVNILNSPKVTNGSV